MNKFLPIKLTGSQKMNRIVKFFGSLIVSAAAITAFTITSYADTTTEIVIQSANLAVKNLTAERTGEGVKISWDNVENTTFVFLLREKNGMSSDFWLLSPETDSFTDTAAPDDSCEYYIQNGARIDGTIFISASDRVTVPAVYSEITVPEIEEVSEKLNADLKIGSGKAVVSWNKTNASGYIVTMDGKDVYDTKANEITSYTVTGLANYSKHTFTVKSYSDNGIIEESAPMVTTSLDTILNSARTSQTRSFTITNRQTAATSTAVKNLSDHDLAVIEKFAAEHFTADMTDAQKIQTALTWVNRNVRYAATSADWSLIGNKSYADAIFTYKCGQCAQYNGAMVSLMRYLGYDADMVLGWRGNSYSHWQHYWGEIEIDGLRFIIEAGNYGASGSWSYLLVPYSRTDGRFIMYG